MKLQNITHVVYSQNVSTSLRIFFWSTVSKARINIQNTKYLNCYNFVKQNHINILRFKTLKPSLLKYVIYFILWNLFLHHTVAEDTLLKNYKFVKTLETFFSWLDLQFVLPPLQLDFFFIILLNFEH